MNPETKYLVIAEDNPIINEYAGMLNAMVSAKQNKIAIDIPPSAISDNDSGMIGQMIVVAQHKREWIESLLYGIKFKFQRYENVEDDFLEGGEWATDVLIQQWFFEMGKNLPFVCFFLYNIEARLFSINGDFFNEVVQQTRGDAEEKMGGFKLTEDQLKITNLRLFLACLTFYTYCNQTGIDPQLHIENMIKEIQGGFTFDQVKEEWLKNDYSIIKLEKK